MDNRYGSWTIHRVTIVVTLFLAITSSQLLAATNSLSGGVKSRYSDNSRLDSSNEESDLENRVTVDFSHEGAGAKCQTGADVSLGYGEWVNETFDPEVYTSGGLNGICNISERIQWRASNVITQQTEDSREADTPNNRTRKNVFSTGPLYSVQLSPVDTLSLSASYVNTEFEEEGDPDSNRIIGTTSYLHNLSPTLGAGLSGSVERAELDTEEELDKESLSVTFNKSWAVTSINGAVGINRLTSRLGQQEIETDGITVSLGVDRQINPTARFSLSVRRELTDQTSTLGVDFDDFSFNLTDTAAVEVTAATAGLQKQFSDGSNLSARAFADRSDFVRSENSEDSLGFSISYSRPVSTLTSVIVDTGYRINRYSIDDSEDTEVSVAISTRYRLTSRMTLSASVGHDREDSDVAGRGFEENWASVSLGYQFF
ncbi:outer membrane beta-barrel protein [Marinobacter sp. bablab_jr008]|uniref:outer membrane beta-barrel protein n=1 Tax=Marinobacter sp. bablab_jr008 TaxID=2755064 RepID=UPI0018F26676|nr:outer membrane beta-barrel protein [Marinobacter sp. bablab_jr008]